MTGSDFSGIGDGFVGLFYLFVGIVCVTVPLALWKLFDICYWMYQHVHVGVTP